MIERVYCKIANNDGTERESITDFLSINFTLILGDVGIMQIDCGKKYEVARTDKIHIYFQPYGSQNHYLIGVFNVIGITRQQGQNVSSANWAIIGACNNVFIKRRVIAYRAGSTEAKKEGKPDALMVAYVDENLGGSSTPDYDGIAITSRDLTAFNFAVESATGLGTDITKSASFDNLLSVLQAIQGQSKQNGLEIFFGMRQYGGKHFRFTTTPKWGSDYTSAKFSYDNGSLSQVTYELMWDNQLTNIYVGGSGTEENREIVESEYPTVGKNPMSRNEGFISAAGNYADEIETIANEALGKNRLKQVVVAEISDTTSTPFGGNQGWNLGDTIIVDVGRNTGINMLIRAIKFSADSGGKITVTARGEEIGDI